MVIITIFILFVGGGWLLGRSLSYLVFGNDDKYTSTNFIDKSTHYHYHDNRSVLINGKTINSKTKKGDAS